MDSEPTQSSSVDTSARSNPTDESLPESSNHTFASPSGCLQPSAMPLIGASLSKRSSFHTSTPEYHYNRLKEVDQDETSFDKAKMQRVDSNQSHPKTAASLLTRLQETKHPFSSFHEPPNWILISVHLLFCLLAAPIMTLSTSLAQNRSLFLTRLLVACGCTLVGGGLSITLVSLGQRLLEAVSWATIIHQSHSEAAPGMKLRDLAAITGMSSIWTAYQVFRRRLSYSGATQGCRSGYDSRHWTLYVFFFLTVVLVAGSLSFLLGRIADISTRMIHQEVDYKEVRVKSALSEADLKRVRTVEELGEGKLNGFTLFPRRDLPSGTTLFWNQGKVYFSDNIRSQLDPYSTSCDSVAAMSRPSVGTPSSLSRSSIASDIVEPGTLVRFPRWGSRIRCTVETNTDHIVLPTETRNTTLMLISRDTLQTLFSSLALNMPNNISLWLNATKSPAKLQGALSVDQDSISAAVASFSGDDALAFDSILFGTGLTFGMVEAILVRLDTSMAPNGTFLKYSNGVGPFNGTQIGYDAAVCLRMVEPWIVDAQSSAYGSPSLARIINPGTQVVDEKTEKLHGDRIEGIPRNLSVDFAYGVYPVALSWSSVKIAADSSIFGPYTPSPMVIAFSNSSLNAVNPKLGYTQLSANFIEEVRGVAEVTDVLPYLSGCDDIVARSYQDRVIASAHLNWPSMLVFLIVVAGIGLLAGLFVPKLPLGAPRREFQVYSWLAAFSGGELRGDMESHVLEKHTSLEDLEETLGDVRFRFID